MEALWPSRGNYANAIRGRARVTRILCVGDIHARDRAPRGANEPYLEDLLDLLRQTIQLESKYDCDAVVWAGDVFHEKAPSKTSHSTVLRMIEIVQGYKNLWIVPGNHDVSNDVLDSIYDKQPLGILYRAGAKELSGWHPELPLYGIPWQQDWHEEGTLDRVASLWLEASRHQESLIVTHAPLYAPQEAAKVPFDTIPLEELSKALGGSGSLYYGHIHEDHGIYAVGGVTYCNMGALSRGSLHEYNIERDIKVALWEDGEFTEIKLDAKPAEQVLRVEAHLEAKEGKLNLESFLDSIGAKTLEISSTSAVVDYIRGRDDLDRTVKDRAIKILEDAE